MSVITVTADIGTINKTYYFWINSRLRSCPAEIWDALVGAADVPHDFRCNGCTASPDSWRGYLIWPACRVHDHDFREGSRVAQWLANTRFRINLWRCLGAQDAPWHLRAGIATVYFAAVAALGDIAYKGDA